MKSLDLRFYGDSILRQTAEPVVKFDDELREFGGSDGRDDAARARRRARRAAGGPRASR